MPQPIDLGKLRFSYNGVFDNGKLYEVNDVVKYGGSAYVYTNNISASGNVPTNATYWAKMVDGVQYEDDWSASASYQVNDVVKYGPQTYIALTDNTNTDPSLNANVWDVFTGGMQFVGVWASASLYYPKQVVRLGGSTYIAQLRHTSGSSFLVDHQAGKWTPFTSGFEYLGLWTANTPYLPGDIAALKDAATQKQQLNDFIDKRFRASMDGKRNELSDALKRYTIKSMQQYRTRYFLAKLTQFVDMAYKGVTTPGSLDDYMVLEMEHILPN